MGFARAGDPSLNTNSETAKAAYTYEMAPGMQAYGTLAWIDQLGINSEFGTRHGWPTFGLHSSESSLDISLGDIPEH